VGSENGWVMAAGGPVLKKCLSRLGLCRATLFAEIMWGQWGPGPPESSVKA
jgi:hypothetical protein